ncbi:MFS transporter [Undibacterium sp. SXout11W]|uniref:MFS transporter n=1 Tax=Undibacterium sp. SXout11W TaxID=3413050 RepID=UPI003BF202E9
MNTKTSLTTEQHAPELSKLDRKQQQQSLIAASAAHAVHDGMTDLVYVLLPIWQSQFGISYAIAGLMRGIYAGCMAGFQIQASKFSEKYGRKTLLVGGTTLAGIAYLIAGQTTTLIGLIAALALAGIGASTQHPLASSLVADAYDNDKLRSRSALATYNFAGDIGKMALPAAVGVALTWWSWRQSVGFVGLFGIAVALWLVWAIREKPHSQTSTGIESKVESQPKRIVAEKTYASYSAGFHALLATGVVDTATRMGFLTFLPFVLKDKGATTATIGLALSLLFVGGAAGKLVCGDLGRRIGMLKTVWFTEILTAIVILCILNLPLTIALMTLPIIGLALNGTSSVLYGSVPELVDASDRTRAFALFYTGTIGGGALSPICFGWLGDHTSIVLAMQFVAAFVCLTLPLAWIVNRELPQ